MKRKYKIMLIIGIIIFLIPLGSGIYYSIKGYSGLCLFECKRNYGFKAFFESIYLYSYILWPTYIVGAILIALSIIKKR